VKRVLGIARGRAGRVGLVAGVLVAAVVGLAGPAGANTGHVQASQTCQGWSVTVTLDNNVTPDHFVEVTSTIPGTNGIVDGHYNTIGHSGTTQIWSASGATVTSGTVTLTILNANRTLDTTTNAPLPSAADCVTTTTQASTTTTCECNNTTTSQAPTTTTTTTYPVTTTTEHHCDCATTTTQPETTTTQGRCECTTSTTQPATTTTQATTTSTTEPQTTTTVKEQVLGSTTIVTTSTTQPKHHTPGTVQHEGSTIVVPTSAPASTTTAVLPHTGSNTTFPVIFGGICLALGSALALRKRSAWSRP
jgi:LPXTG-motif cell wall-anchored protein